MIYPYHTVRREGESRLLPLVPVTLHRGQESVQTTALVDSGAEHNIFGLELAEVIGVSLEAQVLLMGFDGREAEGFIVPVELQLGKHRWTTPVVFSEALSARAIIGQLGFFKFFTVTFNYREGQMDIARNDY